jgi:hypothetical protein
MTTPNSSPNLMVPASDPALATSEEARRLSIRCRELLHFARHVQRSRQRLKDHDEHLAWVNRQVTQKLYRQRVEQAQWAAEQGHREGALARETERIAQLEQELAQREAGLSHNGIHSAAPADNGAVADLQRQLAAEREAHRRAQEELNEALAALQESRAKADQQRNEQNGHQAERDQALKELENYRSEAESLRKELELRKREAEEAGQALTVAREEAERLRAEEMEAIRKELERQQQEFVQAQQSLTAAQAEAESLRQNAGVAQEANTLRVELDQLRDALAKREREHSEALEKLADLERMQQSSTSQQAGQQKALTQEIESLHKLLAERDQAHMEAAALLSELKRSHQNAMMAQAQELETIRQQLAQAETEKAEATQAAEKLREELAALGQQSIDAPEGPVAPPAAVEKLMAVEKPAAPPVPPRPATPPPVAATAPAAPPARPSRPQSSARIVIPPEAPTVIAPPPAAARPSRAEAAPAAPARPPSRAEVRVPLDLSAIESGLAALRKELEADRKALEADLAHGDELKSGQREPSPGSADLVGAQSQFERARELLKAESESFQRPAVPPRAAAAPVREKAAAPAREKPEKPLIGRRPEVESSPVFELPPLKPSTLTPPEAPPPAKEVPRQRGTLHGLRKWLGEK